MNLGSPATTPVSDGKRWHCSLDSSAHFSTCSALLGQCNSGDLQLQDGNNTFEGRVEYCIDGLWTTICDLTWGVPEATVVCRQLGLSTDCKHHLP